MPQSVEPLCIGPAGNLKAEHQAGNQSNRGTQENLWPKLILKSAPIARHFVYLVLKHTRYHTPPH